MYPQGIRMFSAGWYPSNGRPAFILNSMSQMLGKLDEIGIWPIWQWNPKHQSVEVFAGSITDINGRCSSHLWKTGGYPLVNCHILPWKITIFNGKIHYSYGHFPSLFVSSPGRVGCPKHRSPRVFSACASRSACQWADPRKYTLQGRKKPCSKSKMHECCSMGMFNGFLDFRIFGFVQCVFFEFKRLGQHGSTTKGYFIRSGWQFQRWKFLVQNSVIVATRDNRLIKSRKPQTFFNPLDPK